MTPTQSRVTRLEISPVMATALRKKRAELLLTTNEMAEQAGVSVPVARNVMRATTNILVNRSTYTALTEWLARNS